MSAEQMAFLEARKKAQAAAKAAQEAAEKENKPVEAASGEVSASRRAQDAWKWMDGKGALGQYTVFFHGDSGAAVEIWHGGPGSFTFRRAGVAQMKYCSAQCSMQDESAPFAPGTIEKLAAGEGKRVDAGIAAGEWGQTAVKEGRVVLRASVETRDGETAVELHLLPDGFVFISAEPSKCVAVRHGELMTLPKAEAVGMLSS